MLAQVTISYSVKRNTSQEANVYVFIYLTLITKNDNWKLSFLV